MRFAEGAWRDVGLAVRSLQATPVVTAVAVISLAFGIGANTAIFSLVDTLGVAAVLGRTVAEADDVIGDGPEGAAAVVSYEFWQHRFSGSPTVLGLPLTINGAPFVASRSVDFPPQPRTWGGFSRGFSTAVRRCHTVEALS